MNTGRLHATLLMINGKAWEMRAGLMAHQESTTLMEYNAQAV